MPPSGSAATQINCGPDTDRRLRRPTARSPAWSGSRRERSMSRTQRWQSATAELHRVLTSQADALSSAAAAYAQTEDNNRDRIASLDPTSL